MPGYRADPSAVRQFNFSGRRSYFGLSLRMQHLKKLVASLPLVLLMLALHPLLLQFVRNPANWGQATRRLEAIGRWACSENTVWLRRSCDRTFIGGIIFFVRSPLTIASDGELRLDPELPRPVGNLQSSPEGRGNENSLQHFSEFESR